MVSTYREAIKYETTRPLAEGEVQTHEGGIAFGVDIWTRLRRFLILGTESGSYYADATTLTVENLAAVKAALAEDPVRTIQEIVQVSKAGRAPKNDPAILALAMASVDPVLSTRHLAYAALPEVCRTGTHILHYAAYRDDLGGGMGRGNARAIGEWFTAKSPRDLAYQAIKYPSRDKWALRDLLRMARPDYPDDPELNFVMKYIVDGWPEDEVTVDTKGVSGYLFAAELSRKGITGWDIPTLIRELRLPRETIATELLNRVDIWDALLDDMPLTALIRNLGKMTSIGLIEKGSDAAFKVVKALTDAERIHKARIHPIALLAALVTYQNGHGYRGKLTWTPVKGVINALDEAFYLAFPNVLPTGRRIRVSVDVSGSMSAPVNGMEYMSARMAATAIALVMATVEPDVELMKFDAGLQPLGIKPSMRLDEAMRIAGQWSGGATYCTLPISEAYNMGREFDAFVTLTDSETWNGSYRMGPNGGPAPDTAAEMLVRYREKTGIPAAHAVGAFAANDISVADPNDARSMDFVGFDTNVPVLLQDFLAGSL